MISRKPLSKASNNLNTKPAPIKPYSLLTFGLQKLPGTTIKHRMHQNTKSNPYPKDYALIKSNKENNQINLKNIPQSKLQEEFSKISKNQNLVSAEMNGTNPSQRYRNNIDSFMDDDGIAMNHSFFKLQNITNQMISEDEQKTINRGQNYQFLFNTQKQINGNLSDQILQQKNPKLYVDMKKKIKKLSKRKLIHSKMQTNKENIQQQRLLFPNSSINENPRQIHRKLLMSAYNDSQVFFDSQIYRNRLIPQRIDNDIDTDDEQVTAGIKRLKKSLEDAAKENQIWQKQKQKIVDSLQDLQYFQDYQSVNLSQFSAQNL